MTQPTNPTPTPVLLWRDKVACPHLGVKVSQFRAYVRERLVTAPVKISARLSVWPSTEIVALQAARIAGRSDDEIRALVETLEGNRQLTC